MVTDGTARRAGAALLALLAFLAAACARRETGATIVRASTVGALPRESVALLVVDLRALGQAAPAARWMREMAEVAEQEGPFRTVRERFGEETLRDLHRLGVAIVPRPDNRLEYGLVAEGPFEPARLRSALGGQEMATLEEAEGRPDLSAAVLKGGHLALGPRSVLEIVRANDARRGHGVDGNALLLDRLGKLPGTAPVWGAIDVRALAENARPLSGAQGLGDPAALAPGAQAISSLVSLAFEGTAGTPAAFSLLGRADGEAHARSLADAARGLVALGRMGADQDRARDWLEFLDAIAIDQKGLEVTLRGTVPKRLMGSLAERSAEERP